MIIKNKELNKMLKEHGRQYTLTMYVNRYFHMTKKQLDRVMNYKEGKKWERKNIKNLTMCNVLIVNIAII